LTTLKIRVYPKTLLFSDEQGSDTNCWWENPLVVESTGGGFKTLRGDKTHCFISGTKAYNINKSLEYTPSLSLFLSSVSLNYLPHK
jgi:hypothetical protein